MPLSSLRLRPGLQLTGYVLVPSPGTWTFRLDSDDGKRMFLDDTVVIVDDGYHGNVAMTYDALNLVAGLHSIRRGSMSSGVIA